MSRPNSAAQVISILGLAVGSSRIPAQPLGGLEVEAAHVDEGSLEPVGRTGVLQLCGCRHDDESGDEEESSVYMKQFFKT